MNKKVLKRKEPGMGGMTLVMDTDLRCLRDIKQMYLGGDEPRFAFERDVWESLTYK